MRYRRRVRFYLSPLSSSSSYTYVPPLEFLLLPFPAFFSRRREKSHLTTKSLCLCGLGRCSFAPSSSSSSSNPKKQSIMGFSFISFLPPTPPACSQQKQQQKHSNDHHGNLSVGYFFRASPKINRIKRPVAARQHQCSALIAFSVEISSSSFPI